MKNRFIWNLAAVVAAAALNGATAAAQSDPSPTTVAVLKGTASFDSATNVPAVSVHGKSADLQGHAQIHLTGDGLKLERVEARLPVKTITTGLGMRDAHMRQYIFTTPDGQIPDVTFFANQAACAAAGREASTCSLAGQLTIRDTARPFNIVLKVTKNGTEYKAVGDGAVTLSTYGIERPSQLGVMSTDDVKVHLEFTARAVPAQGARR